jgi:hypothetical protein
MRDFENAIPAAPLPAALPLLASVGVILEGLVAYSRSFAFAPSAEWVWG